MTTTTLFHGFPLPLIWQTHMGTSNSMETPFAALSLMLLVSYISYHIYHIIIIYHIMYHIISKHISNHFFGPGTWT